MFSHSLGAYFKNVRIGLVLLVLVGVVRFLMKPVLGIPAESGSALTGVAWLWLILVLVYSTLVGQKGGRFGDVVGTVFVLSAVASVISVVGIALDEFGGIDTYFTDPRHGGSMNPWLHMGGHLIAGIVLTIAGSLIGGLVFLLGRSLKRA